MQPQLPVQRLLVLYVGDGREDEGEGRSTTAAGALTTDTVAKARAANRADNHYASALGRSPSLPVASSRGKRRSEGSSGSGGGGCSGGEGGEGRVPPPRGVLYLNLDVSSRQAPENFDTRVHQIATCSYNSTLVYISGPSPNHPPRSVSVVAAFWLPRRRRGNDRGLGSLGEGGAWPTDICFFIAARLCPRRGRPRGAAGRVVSRKARCGGPPPLLDSPFLWAPQSELPTGLWRVFDAPPPHRPTR